MLDTSYRFDYGLAALADELSADLASLRRRFPLPYGHAGLDRRRRLIDAWSERLEAIPFESLSPAGKIDAVLLRNHVERERHRLRRDARHSDRLDGAMPFGPLVAALEEERMSMRRPNPEPVAGRLERLANEIEASSPLPGDGVARQWASDLKLALDRWREFYLGYDPTLDWWVRRPLERASQALQGFLAKWDEADSASQVIPGYPVGREELETDLRLEMIPYSPEELIAIGEREYGWCRQEMLRASRELGCGDDWKAALEKVKDTCVPPGEQTEVVRNLAMEAIDYVESHDLLTVPELAKETWRMEMMSAERQKVNPFFLGGEAIIVSYPTDGMTHEEKRMSMRGNNPNFSRATVQHELIPGHHMQMYMTARFRKYREMFSTPFWIEGWTLYWELLLWDLGFPRTPEERIGMLFWRMHRCVRISFSLRFHLGELTTAECVDILVDRVGHERANAEGEVRRSFNGTYPPLYQAAYMIGGLQFRAMARELVGSGRMTHRQFHDAIMKENEMPPTMLRQVLLGLDPGKDGPAPWHFDSVG